jgi:hypothetical protein
MAPLRRISGAAAPQPAQHNASRQRKSADDQQTLGKLGGFAILSRLWRGPPKKSASGA